MIGLAEIEAARARLGNAIYKSPCARSETLSRLCSADTYLKLENLQMTGSFKERGALNKILQLGREERQRGLITASAGNHAQAVAYHAGIRDIPATVVMPVRTPLIKVTNTRSYGARVVLEGDNFDAAVARARQIEAEEELVFVHPFDDEMIIAGQGTIALELMEQAPELEVIVVPIGGGGVIAGIATAYKERRPEVTIIGVETTVLPSMQRSVEAGTPVSLEPANTIADGIAVKRPGELTLRYVEKYVDDIVTVDDEEIANAILLLLEQEKTVVEGAGATPLAALYNGHIPVARDKKTCLVLCGGNIDVNLLSRIIERGLTKDGRLVRFLVKIEDRPGGLAALLNLVAGTGANVLEVEHDRAFTRALDEVTVELTLETRGPHHVEEVRHAITSRGLRIRAGKTI